jgi:glycosyltransferase involved in cell wall biosynthesis
MAGIPVVASDLAPIRDALKGSAGHTLIPVEDEEAFADAVIAALKNRKLVPSPQEWRVLWSLEQSVRQLCRCYLQLVEEGGLVPGNE